MEAQTAAVFSVTPTSNGKKSDDKMLELLAVLGVNVKPDFEDVA
jgi:hypothetical protein